MECFRLYFLSLVVVFNSSVAIFLFLSVDLICSEAHILTTWVFLWCLVTENCTLYGVHQVRCFFVWRWNQSHNKKVFVKKFRWCTKLKKMGRGVVSVNNSCLMCLWTKTNKSCLYMLTKNKWEMCKNRGVVSFSRDKA